jgi:hypothetical protein
MFFWALPDFLAAFPLVLGGMVSDVHAGRAGGKSAALFFFFFFF